MEIEILERKKNELLKREEVTFTITHDEAATPSRETVAAKLAAIVNADRSRTVLKRIDGEFGRNKSKGFATVYETDEGVNVEAKYVLKRNGLLEEE